MRPSGVVVFGGLVMSIVRNSLICNKCKDEIISTHVHDFKYCRCGAIAVDGGNCYLKRVGDIHGYTDTSIETAS